MHTHAHTYMDMHACTYAHGVHANGTRTHTYIMHVCMHADTHVHAQAHTHE